MRLGDCASRFLIGLVTCFATHDGIPAVARHEAQAFPEQQYLTTQAARLKAKLDTAGAASDGGETTGARGR